MTKRVSEMADTLVLLEGSEQDGFAVSIWTGITNTATGQRVGVREIEWFVSSEEAEAVRDWWVWWLKTVLTQAESMTRRGTLTRDPLIPPPKEVAS